jgi:hypothetical protein
VPRNRVLIADGGASGHEHHRVQIWRPDGYSNLTPGNARIYEELEAG